MIVDNFLALSTPHITLYAIFVMWEALSPATNQKTKADTTRYLDIRGIEKPCCSDRRYVFHFVRGAGNSSRLLFYLGLSQGTGFWGPFDDHSWKCSWVEPPMGSTAPSTCPVLTLSPALTETVPSLQ